MKSLLVLVALAGVAACGGGDASAREAHPGDSSGSAAPAVAMQNGGDSVLVLPSAALEAELATLARRGSPGQTFATVHGYRVVESRRTSSGSVEVHDDWTDVTVVQAGRAVLRYGGAVSRGALTTGGEHRGGTITSGTTRALGPGDLVIVPARTPHRFELARGDSIRYLTVKVPATR